MQELIDFTPQANYAVKFKEGDSCYYPDQFTNVGTQLSRGSRYQYLDAIEFYADDLESAKSIAMEFGRVFRSDYDDNNWQHVNSNVITNKVMIPHFDDADRLIREEYYKIVLLFF